MSTIDVKYSLYDQYGREVNPCIPDLQFTSSETTGYNRVSIAGLASNATVPITDLGTVALLELKVSPDDVDKITVKLNGSSSADAVSPLQVYSENLSSITASNSSSSAVIMYWRAVFA